MVKSENCHLALHHINQCLPLSLENLLTNENDLNNYSTQNSANHQLALPQVKTTNHARHCLIAMIEKWLDSMDKSKFFGALLTDLSKAFDCLPHDLLAAKLSAYGFDNNSTKFLFDYLTNRKQRTKIGQVYSSWDKITSGVPQGSILVPLTFNIDLIDIFYILNNYDIASYADDNTPYVTCETMESLIESLEKIAEEIFKWFKNNEMQANADKCHVLISTDQKLHVNIGTLQIENSKCEKLLGVNIDSKLSFEKHLNIICGKARAKICALGRVA